MKLMKYTCRTKCFDQRKIVTFIRTGYFENTDILRYWLSFWSNFDKDIITCDPLSVYYYYETNEQMKENELSKDLDKSEIPEFSVCYFDKQRISYY